VSWGDVADLVALLDVQPTGSDGSSWVGALHPDPEPGNPHRFVVEGSQLLGESIVAASRRHPGRRVVSAWMCFVRPADTRVPVAIELEQVADGRTFTALDVRAVQERRTCATGSLLLDATAPDVMRHAARPPDVPGPDDPRSVPVDMGVAGRDVRIVDDAYTGDPDAPVGPPVLDAWVRFTELPREVPDDAALHAGLLAQLTGHLSIAAAMRPHAGIGQDTAHRTMSTAVNAISLAIHADARVDQWLLYHHESTFAGDGMTHSECRVHVEEDGRAGALVASFTVDCMVRAFADPTAPVDERRAL
jgi:acyl-CoA thioesterase II